MISLLNKSEILIQSVSKELEFITKRIFAIKKVFYYTNNLSLKKRLSEEYMTLCSRFKELRSKVILFRRQNKVNLSYSSILIEKYNRCEKLIYKNKNLFFV